jgi:hypothetical protein
LELTLKQEPMPESKIWLDSLSDELPEIQIEKQNFEIAQICGRARKLLESIKDPEQEVGQVVSMVKEMHSLDRTATTWRKGPSWEFKTIHRSEAPVDLDVPAGFPDYLQIHRDVWIAYEWNYHRTARIILHGQLLQCLDKLLLVTDEAHQNDLEFLKHASVSVIQSLANEVLSTVPQSFGDLDHEGKSISISQSSKCRGVGAYFLLWPIKIIKTLKTATYDQQKCAQSVFERIREYTGMKNALGDLSSI